MPAHRFSARISFRPGQGPLRSPGADAVSSAEGNMFRTHHRSVRRRCERRIAYLDWMAAHARPRPTLHWSRPGRALSPRGHDAAPEARTLIANGWLKGSPCLQRADEGHTIVNALGRTSYTPQPQGPPEGFRNPAQSAPESPCPGRGSHGPGGAGVRPQDISRSPRAAASSRGGSRCRPRTIARSAARSRQNGTGLARKACGRTASRRWRKSTSSSPERSSAAGGSKRNSAPRVGYDAGVERPH